MSTENEEITRIREAQQLGFVTALNGAGYKEDDIVRLYNTYEVQRDAREQTLTQAYEAITGK